MDIVDTNANLKRWIAAAKSGKYKKTTHQLKFEDSFCIMGMGCDLLDEIEWYYSCPVPKEDLSWLFKGKGWRFLIKEKYGISDDQIDTLVKMNDCFGKSFEEMADYLTQFVKEEPEMATATKFEFVPGDVVEFEYNGKARRVELDKVNKEGSKLSFTGHDHSVSENNEENWRHFNLDKVSNLRRAAEKKRIRSKLVFHQAHSVYFWTYWVFHKFQMIGLVGLNTV